MYTSGTEATSVHKIDDVVFMWKQAGDDDESITYHPPIEKTPSPKEDNPSYLTAVQNT